MIGSGPNGLSAAIVLAGHGFIVDVFEAEAEAGGAARTLPLTLPGFFHDFGSAIHPLGAASPFFSSLPLADYGLEWIHSPAPLAHPFDDGVAVTLERNLAEAKAAFGADGENWSRLLQPFVARWDELASEILRPIFHLPRHPLLLARFGAAAAPPAELLARMLFKNERNRALFAGMAAHSFLSLASPLSSAFGLTLGIVAHVSGWPFPRGGAQSLTNALCSYLASLGGTVHTSHRIADLRELSGYELVMCDISPGQLTALAGDQLSLTHRNALNSYRHTTGAFKVDYALSQAVPWTARECLRAATVHVGGSLEEIAASEKALSQGKQSERPFVLVTQPSLFDSSRAPAGRHTLWAYCHVSNGSTVDMLDRIEAQIERFAPGFRECVLARRVLSPGTLEQMDANLVGGDIIGGAMNLRQVIFRPTWRNYETPLRGVYLCSASTPPGGGVHGMCGYHAARLAISQLKDA